MQEAAAKAAELAKIANEALEKAQKELAKDAPEPETLEKDEAQMDEEDDEPMAKVAKKKKEDKERSRRQAALLAVAKRSENSRTKESRRRRQDDPPSSQNVSKKKRKSDAEPVVTEKQPAKQKPTAKKSKKPVEAKKPVKRKRAEESSAEPVVSGLKQRPKPVDPRKDLTVINKKTDVTIKKGTKLQIKFGLNKGTLYNATVTKVLNDGFVMVCTQDNDTDIAKRKFRIVRLTEEQAKSGKPSGFTKGCANVGFAVAGAYDL